MNPTDRYRQIRAQAGQWLAELPERPDCRIETRHARDADGGLFDIIDIETQSHVCRININTPIFAPYRHICIEALAVDDDTGGYYWHDGGRDPQEDEIRKRLQELAARIFPTGK
ncbi:MAG: hypothetical protein Q3966_05580 [Neisseria sp.]|nr:hypothetical protein [Neisseria sp.]